MSMESAIKALEAPITAEKAPTSDSQGVPPNIAPKEGPQSLQEAFKPKAEPTRPQIGADRFAALAKKERALQKQSAEIKAREARLAEFEKFKQVGDPLKALEAMGWTYEQLTQFLLNGQKPTPDLEVKQVKEEIERLKSDQARREQEQKEAAKRRAEQEYKTTIEDFNTEIKDYIQSNKEAYELTNMYEGQEIVYATIEQHYANTKKIMSIKEAADLVEQYFEDQVKAAQKTKRFQAQPKPKEEGQAKRESESKQPTPTLTNGLTSSAPSLLPAKTENDRIQRALAALK